MECKYNCGGFRMRYSFQLTERPLSYRSERLYFRLHDGYCEILYQNEIFAPVQEPG